MRRVRRVFATHTLPRGTPLTQIAIAGAVGEFMPAIGGVGEALIPAASSCIASPGIQSHVHLSGHLNWKQLI